MGYWILFMCLWLAAVLYLGYRKKYCKRQPLFITLFFDNLKIKSNIMAVSMTDTQFVTGQITPTNKKGNPAPVEAGSVKITSSNESVAVVTQDVADQTKFTVTGVAPGVAQIDVSADADLGEGITNITGFLAVEILPAQATGFGITTGTPQEQE